MNDKEIQRKQKIKEIMKKEKIFNNFKFYYNDFYEDKPEYLVSDTEFRAVFNTRYNNKKIEFKGDSTDREIMRDLILILKGKQPLGFDSQPSDKFIKTNFPNALQEIEKNICRLIIKRTSPKKIDRIYSHMNMLKRETENERVYKVVKED